MRVFCLIAAMLLTAVPAHATWFEASSEHVVVYAEGKPDNARLLAESIERFDAAFRVFRAIEDHDAGPANRLNVFVVNSEYSVAKLLGPGGRNVSGFYNPRAGSSAIFVPRKAGSGGTLDLDAQIVLFHEYAHHLMFRELSYAYPAWLVEGFAEFHGTAKIEKDGSVEFGLPAQHRAYGLFALDQLPVQRLLDPGPKPLSDIETESLYGRGWLLTHYLTFSADRKGQLGTYLHALDSGLSGIDAGTKAFGDLKQLDRDLKKYLSAKLTGIRVAASVIHPKPVSVRALPAGPDAMMDVHIVSTRGVDRKSALDLLPRARRAATPYPNDPIVQGWLAEAELDAGNAAASLAAAERALVADPDAGHALVYRGRALLAMAEEKHDDALREQARKALIKANRHDPDDPVPMMLLYENFAPADPAGRKSYVDAIEYAEALAPEDEWLRMLAGYEYLRAGDLKQGRAMIAPVAFNPHSAPDDDARKLVALIDAGDRDGITAVIDEPPVDDEKDKTEAPDPGK